MGEEEVNMADYDRSTGGGDERVTEWELGLPTAEDLTPLSQPLIPPELATAFSISPEPHRSVIDVNRASQNTLSRIRGHLHALSSSSNVIKSFNDKRPPRDNWSEDVDPTLDGSDPRKLRRIEEDGGAAEDDGAENGNDDAAGRAAMKRPRLVWTPQLHKRFVEVVAHLGLKNAVPKTIMQLMNVEGLTRENVASHLQKYRLYLKRMQGLSSEGPSASDPLFTSTPVPPQSLHESGGTMVPETRRRDTGTWSGGSLQGHGNGQVQIPIPMPYPPQMMHAPLFGMAHGNGQMGMPVGNPATPGPYHGFETHPYNTMQQRDWSGNKFGSFAPYQHVTPYDK